VAIATADTGVVETPPSARVAELLARGQKAAHGARWQEAREAFEAALAIEDVLPARLALGGVLVWQNEMVGAVEHYERAYALACKSTAPDAPIMAGVSALTLALHYKKTFANGSGSRGWLARGARLVGDGPHPLRGFLLLAHGMCEDDGARALELLTRALDEVRATKQRDLELTCMATLGGTRVQMGDLAGMAQIDEAMAATMAGEFDEPQTVVGVACSMVTACDASVDLARLVEWCGVAEKFADRFGCPYLYADCRWHYGSGLAATGDWEGAERELRIAMRAAPEGTVYHTGAVTRLADLRVRQGRIDDAEQLIASVGDKPMTRGVAGAIKFVKGQHAAASSLLQRYIDASTVHVLGTASALELLVEVSIARGDLVMAEFATRRLAELATAKSKTLSAHAEAAAGRVALARGDAAGSRKHLERAIDGFAEHNLPHEAARARLELARALATDDAELARDEVRTASSAFARLGASHDAAVAAQLLRTLEA
jgi:tetratricopeptide (TPR) repeat protein